jgi:hypothetical protein
MDTLSKFTKSLLCSCSSNLSKKQIFAHFPWHTVRIFQDGEECYHARKTPSAFDSFFGGNVPGEEALAWNGNQKAAPTASSLPSRSFDMLDLHRGPPRQTCDPRTAAKSDEVFRRASFGGSFRLSLRPEGTSVHAWIF